VELHLPARIRFHNVVLNRTDSFASALDLQTQPVDGGGQLQGYGDGGQYDRCRSGAAPPPLPTGNCCSQCLHSSSEHFKKGKPG
jgi:hypothetical protein